MHFLKDAVKRISRFADGYGFAVIVTVCVAVITGSAVWTARQENNISHAPAVPIVENDRSASLLMQQSLISAATPTPLPVNTSVPEHAWTAPLSEYEIISGYNLQMMMQSESTGIWSVHDGVDLAAGKGVQVYSVGDGTVIGCGDDQMQGSWLSAEYEDALVVTYSGMAMLAAVRTGDRLHSGQTIGFVGHGPIAEQSLEPHLHLSAMRNGQSIDPAFLLNGT